VRTFCRRGRSRRARRRPAAAELEYHRPILPGQQPCLVTSHEGDQIGVWLLDGTHRLASARLAFSQ
jgi:hypothetical protein